MSEIIRSAWRLQAAVQGKRFIHLTLPDDPQEAWHLFQGLAPALGSLHSVSAQVTPYDVARFHDMIRNKGFTHHPHEKDPAPEGFSAALDPEQGGRSSFTPIRDFLPDHIAAHREAAADLFEHGSHGKKVYQGGWLDLSTHHAGVETSHVNADEGQTRDFGLKHKQMAYYHLGTNSTTYYDPLHDPELRGEEGRAKQDASIEKYADIGRRFDRVVPHEYDSYADRYPLPDKVKHLRLDAHLREQQRRWYAKTEAQSAPYRYANGNMSEEEKTDYLAQGARRQMKYDNLGHL